MNDRPVAHEYEVLLIDDSDGDVELLSHSLREGGFGHVRVTRADRLWVGLELLRSNRYDVTVLDLSLPDSHGQATFHALRRCALDCPIVVVTGDSDDALGAQLVREGAQDCIVKGEFTASSMARALRHAVERHRAEKALEAARQEAIAASRVKGDFVASVSHEIRTPLNAILGMCEVLLGTDLAPSQEEYLRIIDRAGHSLHDLVSAVLDFSSIEAGGLKLRDISFDLREVVETTCEMLAFDAHKKNLVLGLRIDPRVAQRVSGDPGRLRQILVNLIGNAIKFTTEGEVRVDVAPVVRQADRVCFRVSDTGVGIPQSRLSAIFDSFTQADGTVARSHGGTGLGLTISSLLAEAMDGSIVVDSVVGRGSEFRATIRLARAGGEVERPRPRPGLRALVIAHHQLERTLLADALERMGLVVRVAASGEFGIDEVESAQRSDSPFDLVFVDCRMPKMNGFQVAQRLVQLRAGYRRAVMLLTTDHRRGDIERCHEAGFSAYLFKPVRESALNDLVLTENSGGLAVKPELPDEGTRPQQTGLRILLAEDSSDNQLLIRAYLRDSPHELVLANNGIEAIDSFREGQFDLVLMDMQMPIKDGYSATREIRGIERVEARSPTRIVALTAHAFDGESEKSFAAGCDDHVTKPISKRRLLEVIEESLVGGRIAARGDESGCYLITPDPEIADLVPDYLDGRRQDVAALREALGAGDFDRIQELAHNMKGTGTAYGCDALSEIGARMEAAAKISHGSAVDEEIVGLVGFLSRVEIADGEGLDEKQEEETR